MASSLATLAPAPGLSAELVALAERGELARLVPELKAESSTWRPPAAIVKLEQLGGLSTLSGRRFGPMIAELSSPGLLVLALLMRPLRDGQNRQEGLEAARSALNRLQLAPDQRKVVEFLVRDDLTMAQVAFRPDADDPQEVESFASYLNSAALFNTLTTEEHLKMLCLMTLVTLDATGALSPLRSELLWRLFVDTYNHLTKAYGDEVIDAGTVSGTALVAERPSDVSQGELVQFVAGFPKRYLTLFEPARIYEHVRLCRDITQDDVRYAVRPEGDAWELTVATLDKSFLFSNICGVLAFLGVDILDGQALTSTRGLVMDVFRFRDPRGLFTPASLDPLLSHAIAGRIDIAALLESKHGDARVPPGARLDPVIAFDNEASHRFTVLEIVARDAPGLLYRISRELSTFRCEIEMVVISTEGDKAIDVFHVRRDGAKLPESDELPLTEALEKAVDGSAA
jgi:[protein-PII] uridylyltransferase